MKRTINLINYLPEFMKEYREIKNIASAENPEFQTLADISETIRDNQFIESCNEAGIARYEKMLGIRSDSTESLITRVSRVWSKWMDTIPYTLRALKNKLDIILGEDNHREFLSDEYILTVEASLDMGDRTQNINEIIDYMIPANMICDTVYTGTYELEIISEIKKMDKERSHALEMRSGTERLDTEYSHKLGIMTEISFYATPIQQCGRFVSGQRLFL